MEPSNLNGEMSPEDTLRWLTPDAQRAIGNVFDQPSEGIAQNLENILPGSKAALEDLGVIGPISLDGKETLGFTLHGWEVARLASSLPRE